MPLVIAGLFLNGCASFGNKPDQDVEYVGADGIREGPSEVLLLADAGSVNNSAQTETIEPTVVDIQPTVVGYDEYRDPFIGVNRVIFAFNDVTYRYALIPLSKSYVKITPEGFRSSMSNFFYNIKTPIYLINNGLQLKWDSVARNVVRFGVNTTLGLFGFLDPAEKLFNIEKAEAHFGDTLAHYGAGYGVYLVLPLMGPSDLRNGVSALTDYALNPIPDLVDDSFDARAIQAYDYFNDFAPAADQYLILREESEDPYIFFRNYHLQAIQRDADYPSQ